MSHNWDTLTYNAPHTPACLETHHVYKCVVRAINQAGLVSAPAKSNGFTIDYTLPVGGYVLDGAVPGHTILLSSSPVTAAAMWGGFVEAPYGIVAYEAGVGRCTDDKEVVALYPMGTATEHTFIFEISSSGACTDGGILPSVAALGDAALRPCLLEHMQNYCTVVRAQNLHGAWSARVASSGVRVCTEPPAHGVVSDGFDPEELDGERDFARMPRDVHVIWNGFDDLCAMGIIRWSVRLERRVGFWRGQLHRDATWEGTEHSVEFGTPPDASILALAPPLVWDPIPFGEGSFGAHYSFAWSVTDSATWGGGEYRTVVCGTSVLNMTSCSESDGFIYDATSPLVGQLCVIAIGGEDRSCDDHTMLVLDADAKAATQLCWRGFGDDESGIRHFEWAVGTGWGHENYEIHPWVSVGLSSCLDIAETAAALNVSTSRPASVSFPYYLHLRATNRAGGAVGLTRAIVFDDTPPVFDLDGASFFIRGHEATDHFDGETVHVPEPTVDLCWRPSATRDPESGLMTPVGISVVSASGASPPLQFWDAAELSPPTTPIDPTRVQPFALGPPESTESLPPAEASAGVIFSIYEPSRQPRPATRCLRLNATSYHVYTAILRVTSFAGVTSRAVLRFRSDPMPVRNGAFSAIDAVTGAPILFAPSASSLLQLCFSGYLGPVAGHHVSVVAHLCPDNDNQMPARGTVVELANRSAWQSMLNPDAPHSMPAWHPLRCPRSQLIPVEVARAFVRHHANAAGEATGELPGRERLLCGVRYSLTATATSVAGLQATPMQTDLTIDCSSPIGGVVAFTKGWQSPTADIVDSSGLSPSLVAMAWPFWPHACVAVDQPLWATLKDFHDHESGLQNFVLKRHYADTSGTTHDADDRELHLNTTERASLGDTLSTFEHGGGIEEHGFAIGSDLSVGLRQLIRLDTRSATAPQFTNLTASACNRVGLCGPPVAAYLMVCNSATPVGGQVTLHHDEGFPGFFTSPENVTGEWSGFADACSSGPAPLIFSTCIGTTPHGCQYMPMAAAQGVVPMQDGSWAGNPAAPGGFSWATSGLDLRCGHVYHLTVLASSCAGLASTVASPGLKLCCHPPAAGKVRVLDGHNRSVSIAGAGPGASLRVDWRGFVDECGGIKQYVIVLLLEAYEQAPRRLMTRNVLHEPMTPSFSVEINAAGSSLAQGHYRSEVTSISNAGLSTTVSVSFVVDVSPPDNVGSGGGAPRLRWRMAPSAWLPALGTDVCVPASASMIEISWGLTDSLSQIAQHSWAMTTSAGNESSAGQVVLTQASAAGLSWTPVGLQPIIRMPTSELPSRGAVQVAVRSCNRVGLCTHTRWSRGVRWLAAEPSGGMAALPVSTNATGAFVTSRTSLTVQWGNFTVVGCPRACGSPAQMCFHDSTCSDHPPRNGGAGCNAGGLGPNCRFCGFGAHEACPAGHGVPRWSAYDGPTQLYTMAETTHSDQHALLQYELCLGLSQYGCQVKRFVDAGGGSSDNSLLPTELVERTWTNLDLACGATYHASIRATNCAGLTRIVASPNVTLCCTGPTEGVVQLIDADTDASTSALPAHHAWTDGKALLVLWSNFTDICSGVREYLVSLFSATSFIQSYAVSASEAQLWIAPETLSTQAHGELVTISVTAISHAALHSAAVSLSLTIDRTAPMNGTGDVDWAEWALTGAYASLAPTAICVPPDVDMIRVKWSGFADAESGVAAYTLLSMAVDDVSGETGSGEAGAAESTNAARANSLTINASALRSQGSFTQFHVQACNGVGLCTTGPVARPVHTVTVGPTVGAVVLQQLPLGTEDMSQRPSPGYANRANAPLNASWSGFSTTSPGSLAYELCIGSTPYGCQAVGPLAWSMDAATATEGTGSWSANSGAPIRCEHDAFLTVTARDCAGVPARALSSPLRVCCKAPELTGLRLATTDATTSLLAMLVAEHVAPSMRLQLQWGVLSDPCSGVRSVLAGIFPADSSDASATFTWMTHSSHNGSWSSAQEVELQAVPAAALATLSQGERYRVKLRVISHAGHTTWAASPSFVFDSTPPAPGTLIVGRAAGSGRCHIPLAGAPFRVEWRGFQDAESGVRSIELAVGTAPGGQDVLPFQLVGEEQAGDAALLLDGLGLHVGSSLFASLRASNAVGLIVEVALDEGILVLDPATAPSLCV